MWCPAAGCGWNGSGKFCPECGTKTVAELPDLVVICDGKTEDGSACRAEITAEQKFCMNCGKKVDLGLFGSLGDVCTGCGVALEPNHVFCPECGTKKGSQPAPVPTAGSQPAAVPTAKNTVKEDAEDTVTPSSDINKHSESKETSACDTSVQQQLTASGENVSGTQTPIAEFPLDHQTAIPNEGNDTADIATSADDVKETESEALSIVDTSISTQAKRQKIGHLETSDESSSNSVMSELSDQGETQNTEVHTADQGVSSALSEELAVVHINPNKCLKIDDITDTCNSATQLDQPESVVSSNIDDGKHEADAVKGQTLDTISEHSSVDMELPKDQHMENMRDENNSARSEEINGNATVANAPKEDSDESNYGTAESGSNDEDETFHETITVENADQLVENVGRKRKKTCKKKSKKLKTDASSDDSDTVVDGKIETGLAKDDRFSSKDEETKTVDESTSEGIQENMDTSTDQPEQDTTGHESPKEHTTDIINESEGGQTDMDTSIRHGTSNDGEGSDYSSEHDSARQKGADMSMPVSHGDLNAANRCETGEYATGITDESDTVEGGSADRDTSAKHGTMPNGERLSDKEKSLPGSKETTFQASSESNLEISSQTDVTSMEEEEQNDKTMITGDDKTINLSKDEQNLATKNEGERFSAKTKSLLDKQKSLNVSTGSDGSKMGISSQMDGTPNVNAEEAEEKNDEQFVFGDGKNLDSSKGNTNLATPKQWTSLFEYVKPDDKQPKDKETIGESTKKEESIEIDDSSADEDETGENSGDGTNVDTAISRRQKKNRKTRATKTTEKDTKREQPDGKASKSGKSTKKEQDKKKVDGETYTGPGTKASATGNRNDRHVAVHFHVLVSEHFKFDPDRDRLELRIAIGNGWNAKDKVLKYHRTVSENVFEMAFEMTVPFSLLNSGKRIEYKYLVQKAGKEDVKWEHYLRDKGHGAGVNRVLFLPKQYKNTDVWHQFDGFVEKEPTGFGKLYDWFSWKKDLLKHATVATEVFSEKALMLKQKRHTVQEIFEMMDMVYFGTRKVYFTDARCWISHREPSKEMECFVLDCILDHGNQEWKGDANETPEQSEHRLTVALAAAHVSMKFNDMKVDDKVYPRLCRALLIKPNKEENQCMVMEFAKKNLRSDLFHDILLAIAKAVAKTTKDPSWLFLMPWIHLLSGDCQPFQKPEVDLKHDNIIPKWWGVAKIEHELWYFKGKSGRWSIPVEEVLNELEPLFEMDYYLPRTFVAALSLKQLKGVIQSKTIAIEVCLAAIIYQLKTVTPEPSWSSVDRRYTFPYLSLDENEVRDCVKVLVEQLQEPSYSENCTIAQTKMAYLFSAQLLEQSAKANRNEVLEFSVQAFIHCVALYDRTVKRDMKEGSMSEDHITSMKARIQTLFRWTDRYCSNYDYYMEKNLKIWNSFFAPVLLQSNSIRDVWNKELETHLSDCLKAKLSLSGYLMQNFVQLYCKQMDEFNICMQECLSKAAFNAISEGYTLDYGKFSETENRRFGVLLSNFFMAEWGKFMNTGRGSEDDRILNLVLRWPPLAQFLKIYYTDQKKLSLLSEDCTTHLVQAVSAIQSRVVAITNSSISIGELRAILNQREKFVELAGLAKQDSKSTGEFVAKALALREMDMKAFSELAEKMVILTNLCQHLIQVDTSAVDNVLAMQGNIEVYIVSDFCQPTDPTKIEDIEKYTPVVTAFVVSDPVLQILPALCDCNASFTFMKFWENQCRDAECATLEDVVQNVWLPVKQRWDVFAKQVSTGQIKFEDFERVIGRTFTDDYPKMASELKTLKISERVIKDRIEQLKKYRQLATCVQGAKVVLSFAKEYKLTGDFSPIRDIAQYDQKDFQMGSFDDSLMKTCEFLEGLTEARSTCLKTFVKCGPLVTWLKTSMKQSGLRELKVFVDLAFMSAGDDTMNIARVQCLHSAVTGYAPLIFDLQQTADYKDLLQICDVVWKELDANASLPQKLKDTTAHLEWLKEIEKAHGSVEVTSLVQSDAINSGGVYTVGRGAQKQTRGDTPLGIDSDANESLRLTVAEAGEEGKRQRRNYTYTQLQDLQSRLMLVAGQAEKGNDGVEMFTMIYDSVKRLANVYMRLCCSGCVLFRDWTATFMCDGKRPVCTILEFGQGEDVPTLKGRRNQKEDLREMIPRLAKFMESCHEDWLQYIKRKRQEYLNLNYFTVDQLVILQREIVKLGTAEQPSHLIYPLLSAVKADCSTEDLVEAMTAAQAELDREQMETVPEGEDEEGDDDMDQAEDEGTVKQRLIQELVESGYERRLAQRAVEHVGVGPDAETECFLWCMNHGDEMEDETDVDEMPGKPHVQEKEEFAFHGWSSSGSSMQSMITSNLTDLVQASQNDTGVEPLLKQLRSLWEKFLGSISSNVQDYLSLEHLGIILGHLAQKDSRRIERTLPPGFQEGSPNLIVCPSGDVLTTALSIYMLERDQPFPQPDEVLMCTAHTTIDEVDIFWRRAIFDGGRKIHCLLEADILDFNVSEAAERCLEEYIQETNHSDPSYRLIVICGTDNEYRSRIVAFLDKHHRPGLPINHQALRDYIATKLQVRDTINGVRPAANVDDKRSSARLVKSSRAGVGKTLYKQRREQALTEMSGDEMSCVSLPLQEKYINLHYFIQRLLEHTAPQNQPRARIFHIDIAHEVEEGVDYLLFNLLVLGCLMDRSGYVWRKLPTDLYLIETMPLMMAAQRGADMQYVHQMLSILPDMTCRSPQESLDVYGGARPPGYMEGDQLFDKDQFESAVFQRPFQYLYRHDEGRQLNDIQLDEPEGDPGGCLKTLLRHCGVEDPSWAELHHFVWFLNTQLLGFEQNSFVGAAAAEDLPGFGKFVLRFLIQMSRDFSTRSLNMSEESPGMPARAERMIEGEGEDGNNGDNDDLERYQMRRTWESSPHPYLFFNQDKFTFTFLGFYIDRASGNLIDQQTGAILERGIMAQNLYDSLVRNHAPMQENFDTLPRDKKIEKLCNVMGNNLPYDPDDSYELTTDNVKKMMAIYMRFRCDIPVIIMGETGCGKTTLVKFMCALQIPPGVRVTNMILMKVHGGTTTADIKRKVEEAERAAQQNIQAYGDHMYTVLFFDEANTTEAIGLIKEIMCDKSMEGRKLKLCKNLKMVAACNPYRKHSDELIRKLEQAGLGYHVDADETTDKLGRVPMRRLVYRVQPLPQSLLPLVWDFGQLNTNVEDLYIRQMVRRYVRADELPDIPGLVEVVSAILTASQDYMRQQQDECSFVSLRDVDRVLRVMSWFYAQSQGQRTLYKKMDDELYGELNSEDDEQDDVDDIPMDINNEGQLDDVTRSLVLALGVCYHACLKDRPQYRDHIAQYFRAPCQLYEGGDQIEREISCCQDVFLDNVQLEKNIARNMALKENIFMMVVCIELRLPLFLVGKPGSSKSLAKTIVSDAMQGNASREELFKELKQAQMVSFQCSPLSTPDGIVGTFRQCAQFQKDKDLNNFVSIVVLDEVGLAEDSPRMPLKTLHPLLEDGCQGDETPEAYMKVAFVGISNWALDPAKMNRGILVQREVPDLKELQNSATGICNTIHKVKNRVKPLITPMSVSYLEIFVKASTSMREFFGLRDFYSLVKMVYAFAEKSKKKPTWFEMVHAIKRNFGGLDQVDPVEFFKTNLATTIHIDAQPRQGDPDCSAAGLIQACLTNTKSESRYLLLLTENYGALTILQQQILSSDIRPITIFGSSFRSDQEYTQVCRNINKIKVCMETGNTVVLLNLENLYESLYDALNQYYVYFGGERYVDLGLGTHRVKCPVHRNFRLIVVAEKQTVYKKFPIPLINRLEKHFLTINTMLSPEQLEVVKRLEHWAKQFVSQTGQLHRHRGHSSKVGDAFMGYHDDTCSAIVLHVWPKPGQEDIDQGKLLQEAKAILLWCATPAAVVRVDQSSLPLQEKTALQHQYLECQRHGSIAEYLHFKLVEEGCKQLYAQVTTHSKLLVAGHRRELAKATGITPDKILLLDTLSSFDTEQQFSNKIQQHMQRELTSPSLLVIQCDSGDINANLVACARYCVMDEYLKVGAALRASVHIVFIVQLPNITGGCFTGFQCGIWHSAHIDDLWTTDVDLPSIQEMQTKSVSRLVSDAVQTAVPMETEEGHAGEEREMEWEGDERRGERAPLHTGVMQGEEPIPHDGDSAMYQPHGAVVDLEEVIYMRTAGMPVDRHPEAGSRRLLNVQKLILSCVQAALSMLKDKEESSARTTDRVALLLKLFHEDSDIGKQFLQGVSRMIANLLKEKEENSSVSPGQWLLNEAARHEHIQKAGTFRQACIQTLESKISPILAGIIAHLDTNQNLDILQQQLPWKQNIWLDILNTVGTLQLQYSDLQSPKRMSDLKEVVVTTTGCEGHVFKGQMPFSWLIYQQIKNVIKNPQPDHEDERSVAETVEFFVNVLVETSLGKLLWEIRDHTLVEDILQAYLGDFVHFVYLVQADRDHEYQLVCQTIEYKASLEPTEGSLLHRLVTFHIAHQELALRLTYFRAMNSVWPECSSAIIRLKQENPDHYMFKEEEFTFSALGLLIENLAPQPKDLSQPQGRTAWLARVHQMRPVIEKVLSLHAEDPQLYGGHSLRSVQRARCMWTRVLVIKLFLEHVCTAEQEDNITIRHCLPLWKMLGEEANMKEGGTFIKIEKFLKSCNQTAIKVFLGKAESCSHCESILEGPPIVLPCKEMLCDKCFHDMLAKQGDNRCPKCKATVPENWNPERQVIKKGSHQKLKNYQKRCNSFFMDLVSQLCFGDNTPPSEHVVNQLFGYITCSTKNAQQFTKEISVFETGVDPNPVFRSFLLQLLMRTCGEHVTGNLERYLQHAFTFFNKDAGMLGELRQLCVLVVQCLEDIYEQHVNKVDVSQMTFATTCLQNARRTVNIEETNVDKLTGLAETRFGLSVAAKCLDDISQGKATPDAKIRRLIEAAQNLCEGGQSKWPKIYLVKVLCRRYGVELYWDLCRSDVQYLRWVAMRDRNVNEQVEGADRYIVCGAAYTQIREALTKVVLGEDVQHLDQILQGLHTAGGHIETMVQLAMYREVACSQLYPVQQRRVTDNVLTVMTNYAQKSDILRNKNLATAILQNALGRQCPHLTVTPAEDLRHQGIQCMLVHFLCAISTLQGDRTLIEPLIMLMKNPQQNCYLPTMPQDDLEDVREMLLAARGDNGGENPVFYRCPNGHPYVIGNCGRPASVGKCNKCGQEIGGTGYQLRPGNTQLQAGGDQATLTGHILGRVDARGQGPVPERSLTPAYCACLRLFIHLAMYLGAADNPQAIAAVITPDVMAGHVPEFLWAHLQQDMEDIQRGLGKSVDDVLVLAHVIINNIMKQHNAGGQLPPEVCKLSTKNGRQVWEKKFSDTYLVPVIQAVDTTLKEMNQQLAQDNRLGADPLLCLMYEIDTQTQEVGNGPLQDVAEVWRYRTPVSLSHLRQEFDAQGQKGKRKQTVLQQFLKEDHHLRAIRFIPSIFRLHRALFFKYQRKLDKAEASNITVGQLKKENIAGEETDTLIRDFADAWELVRADLRQYLCPTEVGGMIVPKEYCNKPITDRTPISLLLPTTKEAGLCSLAMLDFLMRKQNGFLEGYQKVTKRKLDGVPAREVTSAHLISYDPQHDILPLVLANCQYSFEMGKGTKIEYDFAGLERQLMDRFLFSKSRIDVGRVLQIDQMIYRTEFTNAVVFKSLAEKIPQVGLNSAVKSQIISEIRSLPELCQSLDNLDISISFLKSIGGDPQHSLAEFMENTLKMEISLYSHKAKQICQFEHTQSLWMLLSLQKSKQQAEYKQPRMSIFESVTREFMEDLPEDVTAEFVAYMKQLSVEKLTQLVEVLHEYIILVVAVRENKDDEDYMDTTNQKLHEGLYAYVDSEDQPAIDTQVLLEMPATILYKHSVDTWVSAYRTLLEKRTGQRRF